MLYTKGSTNFRSHVHPTLQRRMRLFLVVGGIMFLTVLWDMWMGDLSIAWALAALVVGLFVGIGTSRIFHLSWNHDGAHIVGRIDTLGAWVLGAYILFEIIRASLFETVIHTGSSSTAITFAFISAALVGRVVGLRGRMVKILEKEKIFG